MISRQNCTENQNTQFTLNNFSFVFENRDIYEIVWKNIAHLKQATDKNIAHARFLLDT
jgi:hypothetical protein